MKEIIIIDDSPVIRLTLSSIFSRYFNKSQLKIYTSVDGLQGLGYVFITRPDLIIVDLTLPKYSGKEVIDFISTNEYNFGNTNFNNILGNFNLTFAKKKEKKK